MRGPGSSRRRECILTSREGASGDALSGRECSASACRWSRFPASWRPMPRGLSGFAMSASKGRLQRRTVGAVPDRGPVAVGRASGSVIIVTGQPVRERDKRQRTAKGPATAAGQREPRQGVSGQPARASGRPTSPVRRQARPWGGDNDPARYKRPRRTGRVPAFPAITQHATGTPGPLPPTAASSPSDVSAAVAAACPTRRP